ncbi:oxygen-independent coproporphyrinogen III oxidase [Ferrovum sp. PN-J185]|uniref:oxygen-independent coproporphyrinogen III oxidase n=1 Tax=Ferrovum sp. PN-J185 TaxID=1356306 RepID=UPI001E3266AE|nr:oxygen-independent coproporphyrinogen III oxidase [Ferrovum sp. PN-J185]MCC6068083.1 oxygen-independent coproporphyrinogen III oxidase [Ferrovum sp. PN-J185]
MITSELIRRFDIPGPRYTSYPTADRFYADKQGHALERAIEARRDNPRVLSLYIHIPFCESVCYYCGCNKIVTKNHGVAMSYLQTLFSEIDHIARLLDHGRVEDLLVAQLHLGGGSPTFLSDEQLGELMSHLNYRFHWRQNCEKSIEVDPRTINVERLAHLKQLGFNRLSFGIQDFDADVQLAIHRVQSFSSVQSLMKEARALQFDSINMDLIYGLPKQTPASFLRTLQQVVSLRPDRIALYGYAHLPERFKPQRRINQEDLPNAQQKCDMLDEAVSFFMAEGYEYIGMDHFALPHDELARVKKEGQLHRNFQGYHTLKDCDLIGFGVSAISEVGQCYSQNLKTVDTYSQALSLGQLPIEKALELNEDDQLRRQVIMSLMCQGRVDKLAIEQQFGIQFNDYFTDALDRLTEFEDAGLLSVSDTLIEVNEAGWFVIRAIAMAFDYYLWHETDHRRFSKVL